MGCSPMAVAGSCNPPFGKLRTETVDLMISNGIITESYRKLFAWSYRYAKDGGKLAGSHLAAFLDWIDANGFDAEPKDFQIVQFTEKQAADVLFGGQRRLTQRAACKLVDSGLFVYAVGGKKGFPKVYAIAPLPEKKATSHEGGLTLLDSVENSNRATHGDVLGDKSPLLGDMIANEKGGYPELSRVIQNAQRADAIELSACASARAVIGGRCPIPGCGGTVRKIATVMKSRGLEGKPKHPERLACDRCFKSFDARGSRIAR